MSVDRLSAYHDVIACRRQGMTKHEISESLNIAIFTINELTLEFREKGPTHHQNRWSKSERDAAIEMSKSGLSIREISKKLGRTFESVRCYMRKARKMNRI